MVTTKACLWPLIGQTQSQRGIETEQQKKGRQTQKRSYLLLKLSCTLIVTNKMYKSSISLTEDRNLYLLCLIHNNTRFVFLLCLVCWQQLQTLVSASASTSGLSSFLALCSTSFQGLTLSQTDGQAIMKISFPISPHVYSVMPESLSASSIWGSMLLITLKILLYEFYFCEF